MESPVEHIFEQRKTDDRYNTSYPIDPSDWLPYRIEGELDFTGVERLSFYIHIPFCQHLCQFCEYSRMVVPGITVQEKYLCTIENDVSKFLDRYPDIELAGFDIGGGTPTALSSDNLRYLMKIYEQILYRTKQSLDFEPSIEGTFQTLDEEKVHLIRNSGIKRISLGVQSSVKTVQKLNKRANIDTVSMKSMMNMLHHLGIEKINLDLMYGLKGQTLEDIQTDIDTIRDLNPDQVTLYELRNNMISAKENRPKEFLDDAYSMWFEELIKMGYHAVYGQNTFSKDPHDKGLSSYLRTRMIECLPYKGFGLSAQSMSSQGLSYNFGKVSKNVRSCLERDSFSSEYAYELPAEEYLAKYIAISAYYGGFSIDVADRILGSSFIERYGQALEYCFNSGYLVLDDNFISITKTGHKYYGAVFSLFFPVK